MALRIDVFIAGEEDRGALDVAASLARLQELLEHVDDAKQTIVTLRLSPILAARQQQSGPDWDPSGALMRVWDSREWVVYHRGANDGSREASSDRP